MNSIDAPSDLSLGSIVVLAVMLFLGAMASSYGLLLWLS